MAISRSNKDQEKKLAALKRQLYGKSEGTVTRVQGTVSQTTSGFKLNLDSLPSSSKQVVAHDVNFLQKDLLKILVLATSAFSLQFILKYILKI